MLMDAMAYLMLRGWLGPRVAEFLKGLITRPLPSSRFSLFKAVPGFPC